jgi:DNA repair protein RadC
MHKDERPYEKCIECGAVALSNAELLAVLLRTGTKGRSALDLAQCLLGNEGGEEGLLNIHSLTFEQLKSIKGIGEVKAVQILCLSELAKRLAKANAKEKLILNKPCTIAEYYMEEMRHQKQETIKLLMLNTKSKLLGVNNISKGTVNASMISPREIFIEALEKKAVAIVLIHNHPSGDPRPSLEDIRFTRKLSMACKPISLSLIEHTIVAKSACYSFRKDGQFDCLYDEAASDRIRTCGAAETLEKLL